MIILYFVIIAIMRVAQAICNKKTSALLIGNKKMFAFVSYQNAVSALLAIVVVLISGFKGFDLTTFILASAMGLALTISMVLSLEAMKSCSLVLVTMVSNAGIFLPAIVGIFLFGENMKIIQWIGIVIFLVGTYFILYKAKEGKTKINFKAFALLFMIFLTNGIVMVLQKYFAVKVTNGNISVFNFFAFAVNAVIFFIITLFIPKNKKAIQEIDKAEKKNDFKKLIFYGIILSVAIYLIGQLITISAKTVPSAILFPISSGLTLIITSIVGVAVFKEKITFINIVGLILGIIGMILLNL